MDGNIDGVKKLIAEHIAEQGFTNNLDDDEDKQPQSDRAAAAAAAAALEKYINTPGDAQQNTPLHGAVFGGHLELVKFLCTTCHANVVQKNELGCSPLWLAAGYNHPKVMVYIMERILLLDANNDDDDDDDDKCPSEKAILKDANSTGDTPFIAAASRGNIETCRTLLLMVSTTATANKLGGKSTALAMLRWKNNGGDTALAVAVGAGHKDVLDLILEWDTKCSKDQRSPQQLSCMINQRNKQGLTPLLAACERGNADIVNRLVQAGAEFLPDEKGASPLSVVSFCGHEDVAKYLLSLPNGITTLLNQQDEPSGCTALWHAARTGNVAMVTYFLEQGADATIGNSEGLTPEQVAAKFKKQAVVDVFFEHSKKQGNT
jgi:ankyrin repeat protein